MTDHTDRGRFHLEITSLSDFAAFVAIIRGKLDADTVRRLTAELTQSTDTLADAVADNPAPELE